jgi:hypothetical protein
LKSGNHADAGGVVAGENERASAAFASVCDKASSARSQAADIDGDVMLVAVALGQ